MCSVSFAQGMDPGRLFSFLVCFVDPVVPPLVCNQGIPSEAHTG